MKAGLFIPCYIDQFYPQVGQATLELLEGLGVEVAYAANQTCCGQPMANAGYERYARDTAGNFLKNFGDCELIVSPSGSCVLHIKEHLHHLTGSEQATSVQNRIFELSEFLTDIVKVTKLNAAFAHRVGLHSSCHGLRGLRLGPSSELVASAVNKPRMLLEMVTGLTLVDLERPDECCGFGGTFSITEEALSVRMGEDRLTDHSDHGAEVITGTDVSCLMHLEGLARRKGSPLRFMHIAEILNSR